MSNALTLLRSAQQECLLNYYKTLDDYTVLEEKINTPQRCFKNDCRNEHTGSSAGSITEEYIYVGRTSGEGRGKN